MSQSDAGKTDANTRDYDRRAYWDSPLWKQKKKNQRIWDAGKDEAIKMGIMTNEEYKERYGDE